MNISMVSLDALNECFDDYINLLKKEMKHGIYTKDQVVDMATDIFKGVIIVLTKLPKEAKIIDKNSIN